MFEAATGTKVEFLTEPYDSFFAKAFQDGTSKAGQYDIYIMDDPWIPQYAAAGILEDLGPHGITMDADYPGPFADLGFWPPRQGPRVKGFETEDPKADRAADDRRPPDADLPERRLRLRTRDLGRPRHPGQGRDGERQDQVRLRLPRRQGQPDRHLVLPDLPLVRSRLLRRQVEPDLQLRQGQGGGRLLRHDPQVARAPRASPSSTRTRRARRSSAATRPRSSSTRATPSSRTTRRSPRSSASSTSASSRSRNRPSPRSASSSTASARRRRTRTTRSRS